MFQMEHKDIKTTKLLNHAFKVHQYLMVFVKHFLIVNCCIMVLNEI
jgi:hypothetical protein